MYGFLDRYMQMIGGRNDLMIPQGRFGIPQSNWAQPGGFGGQPIQGPQNNNNRQNDLLPLTNTFKGPGDVQRAPQGSPGQDINPGLSAPPVAGPFYRMGHNDPVPTGGYSSPRYS